MEMSESGDDEVSQLLNQWGLSDLKAKFKANYIIMQALEYLTEEDIVNLIPKIGQRAIFRGRLTQWRQQNGITQLVPLKHCKQEPGTESKLERQIYKSNKPVVPQVKQQIDTSVQSPTEQRPQIDKVNQSAPQLEHKVYGRLTECPRKAKKPTTNISKPAMQSKVQQFYISPIVDKPIAPRAPSPIIHNADLSPFVTSIIRVETSCDKSCHKNGTIKTSPANPKTNVNCTTILQKLTNSQRRDACGSPKNAPSQDSVAKDTQEQTEDHTEPCPLYPIVKLETDSADVNWDDLEQDAEPESNESQTPKEAITFATDFQSQFIESLDSDSTIEIDSDNEHHPFQLERVAPEVFQSKRKRGTRIGKLDIRNILLNSDMGRHVLNYYERNERLDTARRRMLIDAIIYDCMLSKRHISPKVCCEIAEEIIEMLPNEKLEDYYSVETGKAPRSALYNKFRNMNRRIFTEHDFVDPLRRRRRARRSHATNGVKIDDDVILS